jgi:hypothetical protein
MATNLFRSPLAGLAALALLELHGWKLAQRAREPEFNEDRLSKAFRKNWMCDCSRCCMTSNQSSARLPTRDTYGRPSGPIKNPSIRQLR